MDIMGEFKTFSFDKMEHSDKKTEHDLVATWMDKRALAVTMPIPKLGSVVTYMGLPVCLAGIRSCEGDVGMIDSFVSDPSLDSHIRDLAADILTDALVDQATNAGMTHLIGISKDTHTLVRSLRHGFTVSDGVLVTKELGVV